VKELRGISTVMFFRLCWRAPRTMRRDIDMVTDDLSLRGLSAACFRTLFEKEPEPGGIFPSNRMDAKHTGVERKNSVE